MSEELAVPVGNYRVKISVILTVVEILFSLQNGKRIGTRRYISNICKVHTCAPYRTFVRFVPLGIYLYICDTMTEPSGPSGQRIEIHPPALKPVSILS